MSLLSTLLGHFQHQETPMRTAQAPDRAEFARQMDDYERRLQQLADVVAVVQRSDQYDGPPPPPRPPESTP